MFINGVFKYYGMESHGNNGLLQGAFDQKVVFQKLTYQKW